MIARKSYFILFALLLLNFLCHGQSNNRINYTVNDGLPSSEVYDIFQTKKGYIWFATDRGLCRFNGYEFKSFTTADGLTSNTVFAFFPQKNKGIWCSTLNNKIFYFGDDLKFHPYKYNRLLSKVFLNAIIGDLVFDRNDLYLSFKTHLGYIKISEEGELTNRLEKYVKRGVIINETTSEVSFTYSLDSSAQIVPLFENSLIVQHSSDFLGTYGYLRFGNNSFLIDRENVYVRKKNNAKILDKGNYPLVMGELDSTHFWVGFRHNGYKIYNNDGILIQSGLESKSVSSLFRDHENGLWVSTLNSGVYYYPQSEVKAINFESMEGEKSVQDLTVSDQQELYIAFANGNVVKWSDGESSVLYKAEKKYPAKVQFYRILKDVIICTDSKIFLASNPDSIISDRGAVISFDDNANGVPAFGNLNAINIGINGRAEHLTKRRVLDLAYTDSGYFVASTDGLFHFANNSLKPYRKSLTNGVRFNDVDYYNGKYYAATLDHGLFILDNGQISAITTRDGLLSNLMSEILVENDSVIWACTNKGINRIELGHDGEKTIKEVSISDGLPSNEIYDIEIIGNQLFIGSKYGLASYDKRLLERPVKSKETYYLTLQKVTVNNKNFAVGELINLNYKQNKIELFFEAISFKENASLKYRYRLEELEEDWHTTDQLRVIYPSLPPGNYNFALEVSCDLDFQNRNSLNIPIIISPPYYSTWWFFFLIFGSIIGVIYLFFKLYILTYNKDVTRELLRQLVKRIKRKEKAMIFRIAGKDVKIYSNQILYVKAEGNYLSVITTDNKYLTRGKISAFLDQASDPLEFLRVHRSYIVRIDQVKSKDSKSIGIGEIEIPITKVYKEKIKTIQLNS
jgi:ligand-binding sensor domain-containing protein